MIVMMTAITPSVNAVSLSRSMCPPRAEGQSSRGRSILKPHRQIHRAELVGGFLRRIFARADDVGEGELEGAERHRGAHLQIADQVQFVDAAALLERVAVQEEVAADGAAIDAREDVAADVAGGLEEARARKARIDAQGAVILRQ